MSERSTHFEAIILDCGDTMLALDPPRERLLADVLQTLGHDISVAETAMAYRLVDFAFKQQSSVQKSEADRGAFYRAFNRKLLLALGLESHLDDVDAALRQAFREHRRWAPIAGTLEALDLLGKRYPLYVLANWDRHLPTLLESVGIAHHFEAIHASEVLGAEKPDPRIYSAFADETGLDLSRCAYIGNEYTADVVGGRAAGLTPVLLDHPGHYTSVVDCPYARDWQDALAHIDSIAAG